jgi:ubiquitin carboxyl-terminal hydrolase 7
MIEEEQRIVERKLREREEQHLYLTVKVVTDESFQKHQGFDLASFDEAHWPPTELTTFRALKQEPFIQFKQTVAAHFAQPPERIRLWVLVVRQNKTIRIDIPVPESEPNLSE